MLKFYYVDKEYVDYLKQFEPLVPNIDYSTHKKFVCGIVLKINGLDYFAPISSFKKSQATNIVIKDTKNNNKPLSSIRLCFMFPVPKQCLEEVDFNKFDLQYKRLVIKEYNFCKSNEERIKAKAKKIYQLATKHRNYSISQVCCDFVLLEQKCKQYTNKSYAEYII